MLLDLIIQRQYKNNPKFNQLLLNVQEKINYEKQKKVCNRQHVFGYAPVYYNGYCRICWGIGERTPDNIILQNEIKTLFSKF